MADVPSTGSGVVTRALWLVGGLSSVAIGAVGIIVPGLPTTVFFIVAAWCFSKSSPRLERWVLELPHIGPMVADYRSGLGMPRRAKIIAIAMMVTAVALSVWLALDHVGLRVAVAVLGAVGVWFVAWRVPTRERVLRERRDVLGDRPTAAR